MNQKNKSILFIAPDYHCSFVYRDELRKLGWKADIFVPINYPENMIFGSADWNMVKFQKIKWIGKYIAHILSPLIYLAIFFRYRYHFYYCGLDHITFHEKKLGFNLIFGKNFRMHLWLAKKFKSKIIHLPSGLPDEDMPDIVAKYGNSEESVKTEDPVRMKNWFEILTKYADVNIGFGTHDSNQYKAYHLKYKAIDLELFDPKINIPPKHKVASSKKLRIMHSFMFGEQRINGYEGNIKGSKYIVEAMERLIEEGYDIEYFYFDNIPSNIFRFYQLQADIVVDQLIRGGWGSSGLEAISLGKPVIAYFRPEWEDFYYKCFPETKPLPVVNANKHTIYHELKKLVIDSEYRKRKGLESRKWAEAHLNPRDNVKGLIKLLDQI